MQSPKGNKSCFFMRMSCSVTPKAVCSRGLSCLIRVRIRGWSRTRSLAECSLHSPVCPAGTGLWGSGLTLRSVHLCPSFCTSSSEEVGRRPLSAGGPVSERSGWGRSFWKQR